MALIVDPGPLPDDGTRINVDRTLDTFINNTNVRNFGPNEFIGNEDVNFVVSQTDAPEVASRTPGMLWFARGEGVLYFWDAQQASESLALWVAASNRKEIVVRVQSGPALAGSVVWIEASGIGQFSEFMGVQIGDRMIMKTNATDISSAGFEKELPTPPFFVLREAVPLTFAVTSASSVGAGVYTTAVELGYTPAQVTGDGPGPGIMRATDATVRRDVFLIDDTPLGFSNSWAAHVVGSGPVDGDGVQMVYVKSTPANVGW